MNCTGRNLEKVARTWGSVMGGVNPPDQSEGKWP
jgi:hypothetical protein